MSTTEETVSDGSEQTREAELEQLKAEVDSLDVGEFAQDEDMRLLCRYLRRRGQLAMEAVRIKDQVQAMLKGLESRITGLDYVYGEAAERIVRERLKGQKVKSLKTPFGAAGFRHQAAKLEITDEQALTAAAAEQPEYQDFLKMTWSLSNTAVNEFFAKTGELPPGCELRPEAEKFYVK